MRPRYWLLAGLAVVLGGAYILLFTEWIHAEPIRIVAHIQTESEGDAGGGPDGQGGFGPGGRRNRNGGGRRGQGAGRGQPGADAPTPRLYPVVFTLDASYQLTSVKVVRSGTHELMWHLIADGLQAPTRTIVYGQTVRSMGLAEDNRMAEPLQAGVTYELEVAAGHRKGKTTFTTKEMPTEPAADPAN